MRYFHPRPHVYWYCVRYSKGAVTNLAIHQQTNNERSHQCELNRTLLMANENEVYLALKKSKDTKFAKQI